MRITVSPNELRCPKCGSPESHPNGKWILIRGYKVDTGDGHWWSQCLVCAGYYDEQLNVMPISEGKVDPDNFDRSKGWF